MCVNKLIWISITFLWNICFTLGEFNLLLVHTNDMHGRFEETNRNTGICAEKDRNVRCYGGFARISQMLKFYRKQTPNTLFLNAGDTFTGTAWFTFYKTKIAIDFMNIIKPDVVCLGNHEFDLTNKDLLDFLSALNTKIVAANLDFSQDNYLKNANVQKSVTVEISNIKIGIIGYLTPSTVQISKVGNVKFSDEIQAIKTEAKKLTNDGVNIIIALGHSGYSVDQEIARKIDPVDIVIGGHSHTFLWTGPQPDLEISEGPYPTIVRQPSGKGALVVQMYKHTKYLGVLNVTFNSKGDIISHFSQPVLLGPTIEQDKQVLSILETYRPGIDKVFKEVIGRTETELNADCRLQECNFGNLITDALVAYAVVLGTYKPQNLVGFYNGGGIRSPISPGIITRGDLLGALPFENTVVALTLKGSEMLEAIEQLVSVDRRFPQVSGIKLVIDKSKPPYKRVVSLVTQCHYCHTVNTRKLSRNQNYRIITIDFLSKGGDGVTVLRDKAREKVRYDFNDTGVVAWYIQNNTRVHYDTQDRITVLNNGRCLIASINLIFINVYLISYT